MSIPFTIKWLKERCLSVLVNTNIKKSSYKKIREEIKQKCSLNIFGFLKLCIPIHNILVLKNYYNKNNLIVCIKPYFGNKKIVFEKINNNGLIIHKKDINFNVFEHYKGNTK